MIVTLTGFNTYARQQELNKIISTFAAEYGEMAIERLNGEEVTLDRIRESVQSLPFLTARKLVILGEPSYQKTFIEHIEAVLDSVTETTDVVIDEPKIDKRLSYYKILKKRTDFHELGELDAHRLSRWLIEYTQEQGGTLALSDAVFLVGRVGENQQLLAHEIDKLLLYEPNIKRDAIKVLTEALPQSTIFELLDAAFTGNTEKVLTLYQEQRTLKVEAQQIIAMLTWQLHILALLKTAVQRTPEEIAREARLNPYVVRKSQAIAGRITLAQLKELITKLLALDVRIKSESIDADEALQYFLLSLSN